MFCTVVFNNLRITWRYHGQTEIHVDAENMGIHSAVKVLAHSSFYYAALKVEPYASLSHRRWFRVGHFRCSHLAPPFCCDVNAVQELKDDDDAGDGGYVANQGHVTPSCASHSLVAIMSKQATS